MILTVQRSQLIINKTQVQSKNGLVTAMHPLAAAAGLEILQQGGNAADAAVAAAFAVGVVEPFMSGIGGAAYVVSHQSTTGKTITIDGSIAVPQSAHENMFELLDPSLPSTGIYGWRATKDGASETGYRAAAVPGAVATYSKLLELHGTMSLKDVLAPAIRLASEGFPVDWYVFANCATAQKRLSAFPTTMEVFYHKDGSPYRTANHDDIGKEEWLIQSDLAHTLNIIAEQGVDGFYKGSIGQKIGSFISDMGGHITPDDMANYQVRTREPLWITYRGKKIAFISENSGGSTVAEMLNILEGYNLSDLGHNSTGTLHLIAQAQHMAFSDRFEYMGDSAFDPIPLEQLESKTYAQERRSHIQMDGPPVANPTGDPWAFHPDGRPQNYTPKLGGDAAGQHTTHLNVVDKDRNVVSLTATLGQLFGSGVVVPQTGIVLNNGMMWFDPEPGKMNSIGPGKRALHAGTPAIVFDEDSPFLTLGSPGGRKVLTAVQQVIHNIVDYGMDMQEAISAPRIHCEKGIVHIDARIPQAIIEQIQEKGHEISIREEHFLSSYFARPNGIWINRETGELHSGVEPYKMSAAFGY